MKATVKYRVHRMGAVEGTALERDLDEWILYLMENDPGVMSRSIQWLLMRELKRDPKCIGEVAEAIQCWGTGHELTTDEQKETQ